jgi:hypothetical protein
MKTNWICLLFSAGLAAAQSQAGLDAVDGRTLLGRVVIAVRDNLARLPNYTCAMTIDRYQQLARSSKSELLDKVRLEVATVGNRELYAWPGSKHFEDRPIHDLVPTGSISTGEFSLFPQTIFLAGVARFQYVGLESLNGRKVHHFIYSVPRSRSKYTIRFPTVQDDVGFAGSSWHDAETLDLVRLEVDIREIPKKLPLSAGRLVIDYARVHVGDGSFLLPQSVDNSFTMEDVEDRNHTTYSGCHEYQSESTISFDSFPAEMTEQPTQEAAPIVMPLGITVESKLETQLDSASLATGDPFEAIITKAIRHKGKLIVPKGAKIHGHISRVVHIQAPYTCVAVELQPESIEYQGREGRFEAEQAPSMISEYLSTGGRQRCLAEGDPGTAMLHIYSSKFHVAGYPIIWQTVLSRSAP